MYHTVINLVNVLPKFYITKMSYCPQFFFKNIFNDCTKTSYCQNVVLPKHPIAKMSVVQLSRDKVSFTKMYGYQDTDTVDIIIIINFYGVYILRNLSSETQQNRIIKHNCEQGCTKVIYQNEGQPKIYGEMQFGINMSIEFFGR